MICRKSRCLSPPIEGQGTVSMTLDYLYDFDGILLEIEVVMPISLTIDSIQIIPKLRKFILILKLWRNVIIFWTKNIKMWLSKNSVLLLLLQRVLQNPEKKYTVIANFMLQNYGLKIIPLEYSRYWTKIHLSLLWF